MVDAGRVEFQVGINRNSLNQAVALLDRQLSSAGDIDLNIGNIDTARTQSRLDDLDQALDRLSRNRADDALNRLQGELRDTARAADNAQGSLGNINGVLQAFQGAAAFVALDRLVDLFGSLSSAVAGFAAETLQVGGAARSAESALTTILGSAEAAQQVLQDLNNFAATTPFDLPGIRSAGQQLLAFGFGTEELIPTLEAVGNVAAGVNAPFDELAEIYGRARVQGRLFAEDINQLTGRGIPIIGELANQFGVAETEIRGLVESGQVGFADIEQAFINLTSEGGRFFDLLATQSGTVVGQISNLGDTFTQFQEQVFRALEPALGAGLQSLSIALDEAASSSDALDILSAAGDRLARSLSENPALAERLGEALASIADSTATAAASILDSIADSLSDPGNVDALARGIESTGELLNELVTAGGAALNALVALFGGTIQPGIDGTVSGLQNLTSALEGIQPSAEATGEVLRRIAQVLAFIVDLGPQAGSAVGRIADAIPGLNTVAQTLEAVSGFDAATTFNDIEPPNIGSLAIEVDTSFVDIYREATDQVAENDAIAARQAAAERTRANQQAAEEFVRANEAAIAAIELSQTDRIAGILQNQAAGNITADQADSQIADIEADAIRERIQLRERELARIQELEQQGALSAQEAAELTATAKQAASDLVVQSFETELAAQQRVTEAALERLQVERQQVNLQSELASSGLQNQSSLLEAQAGLEQSRLSLSRQNLEAKLAEAQAAENLIGVEEARDRILLNTRQSIQANFSARRQQLQLQQQIQSLEADRQVRLAEIAVEEARIGGESARTLDLLEQTADALRVEANTKENILAIQFEQLDAEQSLAEQSALRERRDQAIAAFKEQQKDLADEQLRTERELTQATEQRARAADSIVSSLSGLQDISGEDALASLDQLEDNLRSARRAGFGGQDASDLQRAIDQAQGFARSGDGFDIDEAFRFAQRNADNQFTGGVLDAVGLGGVGSFLDAQQEIALADTQISELKNEINAVKQAIEDRPIEAGNNTFNISGAEDPSATAERIILDQLKALSGGG